jgi:UPF0716 protein FxsA
MPRRLDRGRPAEKELTDGMLVGLGGVLIVPPSRAVARRLRLRRTEKRAAQFANRLRGPVMVVDSEVFPSEKPRRDQPTMIEGWVIEADQP